MREFAARSGGPAPEAATPACSHTGKTPPAASAVTITTRHLRTLLFRRSTAILSESVDNFDSSTHPGLRSPSVGVGSSGYDQNGDVGGGVRGLGATASFSSVRNTPLGVTKPGHNTDMFFLATTDNISKDCTLQRS